MIQRPTPPVIRLEPQTDILRCRAAMVIFTAAALATITLAAIATPTRWQAVAHAEQTP